MLEQCASYGDPLLLATAQLAVLNIQSNISDEFISFGCFESAHNRFLCISFCNEGLAKSLAEQHWLLPHIPNAVFEVS